MYCAGECRQNGVCVPLKELWKKRGLPAKIVRRFAAAVLCGFLLVGSLAAPAAAAGSVADLKRFPQDAASYLPMNADEPITDYATQKVYAEEYMRNHFAPWFNEDLSFLNLSFDQVIEYHKATAKKTLYRSDGKPFPKAEIARVAANGAIDTAAVPRPGIVVADADVRVLPTATPMFVSPASALGERGLLKMDTLQNSALKPGEPLAVFCSSKDSEWYFIATGTVVGWVRANKVAFVDPDFMDRCLYAQYSVILHDNLRIRDEKGTLLATAKMGTVLPRDGYDLLLPARGNGGIAVVRRYRPPKGASAPFPWPFTPRNATAAISQILGEPYGWGGMHGFRDCSAMTRDYFSLFGVWIPRNSGDQAKMGASIPLANIPVGERPRTIVENAVPFATLIHMPGHIMLYLGLFDAEPVVLHNVWGVRRNAPGGKTGRVVIGRTVVSSLRAGAEIQDRPAKSLFIDNISSLVFPMANIYGSMTF